MIVFDEVRYYTTLQLCLIAFSLFICCCGIKLLTTKTKMLKAEEKEQIRVAPRKATLTVN